MDISTQANARKHIPERKLAIQLRSIGCTFATDGEGPVMMTYTPGGLRAMGLLPRDQGATLEVFERAAIEAVRLKKPGQCIYIFVRDEILETYLKRRDELVAQKNECKKLGAEFVPPKLRFSVRELAELDFIRDQTASIIDKETIWIRGAYCATGKVEFTKGSPQDIAAGNEAKTQLIGGKRWPLSLDNEGRVKMGIHRKPE